MQEGFPDYLLTQTIYNHIYHTDVKEGSGMSIFKKFRN